MDRRARFAFLLLVLVQAVHSAEEYRAALWEQLAPARALSRFLAIDPAAGFLISNGALFLLGLWCWAVPIRRSWRAALPIAWTWATLEIANGLGHCALALAAGGYFPGLATAPLLIVTGIGLAIRLRGLAGASCGKVGTGFPQKRWENEGLEQEERFRNRASCSSVCPAGSGKTDPKAG